MNSVGKIVLALAIVVGLFYWFGSSGSDTPRASERAPSVESEPVTSEPLEFHGYPCTDDCSGHQAGYDWAEANGITDEDDCGGNSESFIEGCKAYAQEQSGDQQDMEQPAEDGDSDNE